MSTLLAEIKDCVDEQVSNVKKAYFTLPGPYTVRPEFQGHVVKNYFQHDKAKRSSLALKPLKVRIDQKRYNEVLCYRAESGTSCLPLSDVDGESDVPEDDCSSDPFMKLVSLFTCSDVDNLKMKAVEIISSNGIRDGFASQQYIVRSSSDKYRTVSVLSNRMINCEKGCLGFDARKICSHTIAIAMHHNTLSDYINTYVKNCPMNLTTITTTGVNPDAGKKKPSRKRWRPSSPDAIRKSPNTVDASSVTLGDILSAHDGQQSTAYSVSGVSSSGMKLKLKKKKKPEYKETTTTPWEMIRITGNIAKCTGCGGRLKDGVEFPSALDQQLCIRHKEHDHVYLNNHDYWKPTFANRHYHVFLQCIQSRNPSCNLQSIQINVPVDNSVIEFLKSRFA